MKTPQVRAFAPRSGPQRTPALITVFIASVCFLLLTMDRDLGVYDEGLVLSDAMRVAAGEVIHRDFYSPYGPAAYYIVAGLLRLFPMQFAAERLYAIAILAGIVTTTAAVMLDRIRLPFTVLGTLVCLGFLSTLTYLFPLYPSLLLGMIASLLLATPSTRSTRRVAVAGACTGFAAYFRYDIGFLLLTANLGAMAALSWLERPRRAFATGFATSASVYALGAVIVFLPGMVAYLAVAPISAFVADIIEYGGKYYRSMRSLPFPPLQSASVAIETIDVYLPFAALAALIMDAARRRRSSTNSTSSTVTVSTRVVIVFGLLTSVMIVKGWVRVSPLHMSAAIVPGIVVLCVCADRWWHEPWPSKFASAAATSCVLVAGAGAAQTLGRASQLDPGRMLAGWLLERPTADDPRLAHCAQATALWPARLGFDYVAVTAYLRRHTLPRDRILVALDRHDRIFINSPVLYFTADRLPATHWHQFDPGQQTRADIQAIMVDELREDRTDWVVRDASFSRVSEPNESSRSSGVHLLDRYLDREYRLVAASGRVAVWLRNGVEAPPATNGAVACLPVTTGSAASGARP